MPVVKEEKIRLSQYAIPIVIDGPSQLQGKYDGRENERDEKVSKEKKGNNFREEGQQEEIAVPFTYKISGSPATRLVGPLSLPKWFHFFLSPDTVLHT